MPFTHHREFKAEPRLLVRGEGVNYWNHTGDKILDASSGLFCCPLGHCRKEIADAVAAQLMEIDYSPHFQIAAPPSFELARRVSNILPDHINRVFFCNSGSESVDTALKISMAYHRARGEGQRLRFVSRERSYHGVNIGGTSLAGLMKNRDVFGAVIPGIVHMRHTWLPENKFTMGQPETGAELADDLQRFVDLLGGNTIAACFVEPIAGSTGVLVPPKGYLERLREICTKHGILLVFDEVITGIGRCGKAFAAQAFNVMPDIITMAKALTNGAQPMGAVGVSDDIYDTIVNGAPEGAIEFFHGYTYSGHPAACAAGIAASEIYEKDNLFDRVAEMSPYFLEAAFALSDLPIVTDIRGYGLLVGFDVAPGKAPGVRGPEIQRQLFNAGLHMKFTGDSALLAPAFVAEKSDIDDMLGVIREVLSKQK
jgi:beta-alanine--pyruvate transaminase